MSKNVFLVLTSAIGIKGEVVPAGKLVEVGDAEAKNLLHRGKARLATEKDGVPASDESEQGEGGLLTDGPTVAEYVAAGYPASNYPPSGYESRSTVEEVQAAIADEIQAAVDAQKASADKKAADEAAAAAEAEARAVAETEAAAAAEQSVVDRAMKDNDMDAAAWSALSDRKRAALLKAAAEGIAKDAAK